MTFYRMKAVTMCAAAMLITVSLSTRVQAQGGPGDDVFESILYLWEQAPNKFSDITGDIPWKKLLGDNVNTGRGIKPFSDWYDVPGFEKESARSITHKGRPTEYTIAAKRFFASDAACMAYYKAMIAKLPVLLAKYDIEVRDKEDHVFFKQKTEAFRRHVYVKYFPADESKKRKARVYFSVRVQFAE